MDIRIPGIWQRVGIRRSHFEVKAELLTGAVHSGPVLLVMHWPVSAAYIEVTARGAIGEFASNADEIELMLAERGVTELRLPAALSKRRSHCLAAEVNLGEVLTLDFAINTDDPDFLDAFAAESGDGGMTREIELHSFRLRATGAGQVQEGVGSLHIHLEPAEPMRKYDGYVALDLGNTNSSLVALHANDLGHASDVEVISLDPDVEYAPIPTAVRLVRFDSREANDSGRMEIAECNIGNAALSAIDGWLVLGAKRILAQSNPNARHDFWLNGQRHAVSTTLPAELFLSEMFRVFHCQKVEVPRQIAITHPTTFSPFEIRQLREWQRYPGLATVAGRLPNWSFDGTRLADLPYLIIDEASATAFYFIYRDFLDAPGGLLDLLHYLYPEGLNLLICDFGGGTTDIALLHADIMPFETRLGRQSPRLKIEVLGRTGHRAFGGDDITIAAFRALKGRLAAGLSPVSAHLRYPKIPSEATIASDMVSSGSKQRYQHVVSY